jgi:hypothetical protein
LIIPTPPVDTWSVRPVADISNKRQLLGQLHLVSVLHPDFEIAGPKVPDLVHVASNAVAAFHDGASVIRE